MQINQEIGDINNLNYKTEIKFKPNGNYIEVARSANIAYILINAIKTPKKPAIDKDENLIYSYLAIFQLDKLKPRVDPKEQQYFSIHKIKTCEDVDEIYFEPTKITLSESESAILLQSPKGLLSKLS